MPAELVFALETFATPIGVMLMVTDGEEALRAVDWQDCEARMIRLMRTQYQGAVVRLTSRPRSSTSRAVMERYFAGDLGAIDRLKVRTGGTVFQRRIWDALRAVPAGSAISYRTLAMQIGQPTASRAVGLANGANPIGVVVPCHRVIGANGSLTGYGGGLHRKRWLLGHEGVTKFRADHSS